MRHSILLTLALVVFTFTACTKKSTDATKVAAESSEILIGEFGSMTGTEATFGISTHQGIELAFKEVNAAGGIKGKKLKLVSLDDQGKADEAATVVTRLITNDKVTAILGEVASSRTLAAAPIAQRYKIPMITPSSTNDKVTGVGDYIFRVCFTDTFQGQVMARFAANDLKLKKVAIVRDQGSDYSDGLSKSFKQTFKELGGEVVAEETYSDKDIDFKAQLTSIKGKKPDGIFIPGYYTHVGLIARQARGLGMKQPLLGGDGWDSEELSNIGKDAINGGHFSNHYTTETKEPVAKEFIANFNKEYKKTPDGLAAMGYDAAKILADAIGRAKSLSSQDIRDALADTKDFAAVTGKISIDEQRNAKKLAVIVKVDGKENKYVTTIEP